MKTGLATLLLVAPVWAADLSEIQKRGALRVLAMVDEREPEFFSLQSPAAPGLDLEILMGFARARKLELKVVPATGWASLVPALVEGKGDLVAGRFSATAQRRRFVDFTDEVFPTRGNPISPVWAQDRLQVLFVPTKSARTLFLTPAEPGAFLQQLSIADPGLRLAGDRVSRGAPSAH